MKAWFVIIFLTALFSAGCENANKDSATAEEEDFIDAYPGINYTLLDLEAENRMAAPAFTDYDSAIVFAAAADKPVLLNFTAWNCANCRKMEEYIWTDDRVKELLKEFVIVSLHVDEKTKLSSDKIEQLGDEAKKYRSVGNMWNAMQIEKFKSNAQPWHATVAPDGHILSPSIGYHEGRDVKTYIRFLKFNLKAFREYQASR